MKVGNRIIVVIKVTKSCNLRCKYCYMDIEDGSKKIMSDEVVQSIIDKFGSNYDFVDYSWHGGEPTLAGIDFYSNALKKQQKLYKKNPKKRFKNSFQTNGVNISEEWFEFLSKNQFNLGFSYDGPGRLNNNRLFISGEPVEKSLISVFRLLKSKYNFDPGVICVLSKTNIMSAEEIYKYFKEIGICSFAILPYQGQNEELRVKPDEYYDFHKKIFDIWINDNNNPFEQITPLSHIMYSLLGINKSICSWDGRCFQDLITVEPDGGVFLCSSLHQPEHKIGNILTDSLEQIFNTSTYKKAIKWQTEVISKCRVCEVFDFCKGGCREAAYFTNGSINSKDPQCEGRKKLIKYILLRLKEICENENCLESVI